MKARALAWAGFALVHAWLVWLCLNAPGYPMGDVTAVYRVWAENARDLGLQVGIDTAWVYPILAFVPMALALALGSVAYAVAWLGLVVVLDALAFGMLLGLRAPSRRRLRAAAWWLAFLVLLGPIALARIDSITVPLAIVAVLWALPRPRAAAVLLTIGAWMKVWPVAIGGALVIGSRRRWVAAVTAVGVSLVIVLVSLAAGSGSNVFAFVAEQADRGLQIEAAASTPWTWQAALGEPGVVIEYSRTLLTFEVIGPGVAATAAVLTPLSGLVVLTICVVGAVTVRRGGRPANVIPPLALALVTALIVVNKVGSPQFITWLAAPVILAIVLGRPGARAIAILAGLVAAFTQLIYPYLYTGLILAQPPLVLALTVRNVLLVVLLAVAVARVWKSGARPVRHRLESQS